MARGNGGRLIFRSDDDCRVFLGILEEVVRRARARVLAYCLMRNHFHILIKVGDVSLSLIMQRALCRYSRCFNATHNRRGHLFQSRFKAKLCVRDAYLLTLLRYIHNNPVKAGLVQAPAQWLWSSHRQYLGPIRSTLAAVGDGLQLMEDDPALARRSYRRLMAEEGEAFEPRYDPTPQADKEQAADSLPPSLDELAAALERESGLNFIALPRGGRSREVTRLRREFALRAASGGHPHSAIARKLGVCPSAVTQYLAG